MVRDWLEYQAAGLWTLVWHYGIGVGVCICALAWAWFVPIFKKTALWVALGSLIITLSYGIGVSNGSARTQAQWDAAVQSTLAANKQALSDAERDIANGVRDKRDRPDN
jgi:hypothetical protein